MARKFVTLTYHRVTEQVDPLQPGQCHASLFARQLDVLTRFFNVLPLAEAVRRMESGRLPPRCVCISFDDGYLDNHDVALPLLKKAGVSATFFVAAGFLDGGVMWNDRIVEAVRAREDGVWDLSAYGAGTMTLGDDESRFAVIRALIQALRYLEQDVREVQTIRLLEESGLSQAPQPMMNVGHLKELVAAGMHIGGHTLTHPILERVDDRAAMHEIAAGRSTLRDMTGETVDLFAYPNGKPGRDFGERHKAMAKEAGFEAAFSTGWGVTSPDSDRFALPRVGLEGETGWRFAAKLMRSFYEIEQAPAADVTASTAAS